MAGDFVSMLDDLLGVFGRMISKCGHNAGQRRKKSMRMISDIALDFHLPENQIQMVENFSFNDTEFFKQAGVHRAAEEKIHHHAEILIMMSKVIDIDGNNFIQPAVFGFGNRGKHFFENLVGSLSEGFHKQGLLIRKVLVNNRGRNTRALGDGPHRNFVEGLFRKFKLRRVDNHRPAGLPFFFLEFR